MPTNGKKRKVVVITGASAGVGRATVREFARRGGGADIGLIARGSQGLEHARREVEEAGGRALALPVDVADERQVSAAAAAVEHQLGPVDIWVNNAMVSVFSPVALMTPAEFRRVTDVTYLGVVWGTLAALRSMMRRNRGTIVQVGSALAYRSIPLQSAYCAAKHAIRGFTDSLRSELIHDRLNIRLTMVQLPAINTPQFGWVRSRLPRKARPVPPIFQPEVAAAAIYWAAHHHRREVYLGWPTVQAIVGNALAPGALDRILADRGYSGQQYDGLHDANAPDNLFKPLPGDRGAHGDFDSRAHESSKLWWWSRNRNALALGAAAAAAAVLGVAALLSGPGEEGNAGALRRPERQS